MIKVQKDDFDVNKEIKSITSVNKNIGGTGLFIGNVREGKNAELKSMTLEHYPITVSYTHLTLPTILLV